MRLVGFARPEANVTTVRKGATVVLAIDVSGSMAADDVRPTRVKAARAAGIALLDALPDGYRVALVTFADHTTVRVPPTYDRERIREALPVKTFVQGTAVGDALARSVAVAVRAIGGREPGDVRPPATVAVFSDGDQTAGQMTPEQAAERARKAGVPVSTVAFGTPRGVVEQKIPGGVERIQVPVDPTTLRDIAHTAGGRFFETATANQLKQVSDELGSRAVRERKRREVSALFAAGALVFVLAGAIASGLWFRRVV